MTPDQIKDVMRLVEKAINAHRAIFNGEVRPSDFQRANAKTAIKKVREYLKGMP